MRTCAVTAGTAPACAHPAKRQALTALRAQRQWQGQLEGSKQCLISTACRAGCGGMPCIAFKPSNLLEVHIANMKEEIQGRIE